MALTFILKLLRIIEWSF